MPAPDAPLPAAIVHHYSATPTLHESALGGAIFLTSGVVFFTVSFGLLTMVISKLSSDLDELEDSRGGHAPTASQPDWQTEGLLPDEYECGLRLLRMAGDSPLRGRVAEKAIILTINGKHPTTAVEANDALLQGGNRVEWSDSRGKVHTATFFCRRNDLKAQFEQINREAEPNAVMH